MKNIPDLRGWLPINISQHAAQPVVEWCRCGDHRFDEPFFEHSVQQLMRDPFNMLFRHRTSLDVLTDWQNQSPGLQPDGFIFHMSRCGSTLVSQMLSALPENTVLSEPPPLDAILRTDRLGASDQQRITWLRAWMSAMGQPSDGRKRLFVKLDGWHTFDLPLLRQAFPDTPWIFLYRDPVEVLVSSVNAPGMHLVPNLVDIPALKMTFEEAISMPQAEYMARVLAKISQAGLQNIVPLGGLPLEYTTLPEAVTTRIASHFNLKLTPGEAAAMMERTPFYAKQRQLYFEPDSTTKQQEASPEIRALCEKYLDPIYRQLQAL